MLQRRQKIEEYARRQVDSGLAKLKKVESSERLKVSSLFVVLRPLTAEPGPRALREDPKQHRHQAHRGEIPEDSAYECENCSNSRGDGGPSRGAWGVLVSVTSNRGKIMCVYAAQRTDTIISRFLKELAFFSKENTWCHN